MNKDSFNIVNYKGEVTEVYTPMYEYRGFTIYKSNLAQWSKDINYVDANGKTVNNLKPLYHAKAIKNKCLNKKDRFNNIYISQFGGNDGLENEYTENNWTYTKKQIDSYIESQIEYKLKRIEVLKNSCYKTYICNNVTIRVFREQSPYNEYETMSTIYVDERALRNVYLKNDFLFHDVLKQVYYNTISRYNSPDFKDANKKTKYFKTISTEKIDLTILPVYEFLGLVCDYNGTIFTPINVNENYNEGFKFQCFQSEPIEIEVDEIKNIKIVGESNNTMVLFCALKNKILFLE